MRPEELVVRLNQWWLTKAVPSELLRPFRRKLFDELIAYLDDRQVLVIRGLRRTGKTTLLFQLVDHLIRRGVDSARIVYYSFDELEWEIADLLRYVEEQVLKTTVREAGRVFFLLDEVQRLGDWAVQVKQIYDLYPSVKFVVSGSASLGVEKAARESLAGRSYFFDLDPLSFREYLALAHGLEPAGNLRLWESELAPRFISYLSRGLPEIAAEDDPGRVRRYLWEGVTERVLYGDLPAQYEIRDPELLGEILLRTLERPGWYVNIDALSRDLRRDRRTLASYLGYLEYACLIRTVANYRGSLAATSRKLKRAYPVHSCLAAAAFGDSAERLPLLVETAVRAHLRARHYWRSRQQEVDFVLPVLEHILAVEVKFVSREIQLRDLRGLQSFLRRFKSSKALVVSRSQWTDLRVEGQTVSVRPAWAVLLEDDLAQLA